MERRITLLPNRGVVSVTGADAGKLLQGVVTNDMDLLERQPAIHAGILTPQGKILAEFFIVAAKDGFLLDAARDLTPEIVQRLNLYRLRAKVAIEDVSADYTVAAVWNGKEDLETIPAQGQTLRYLDPRLPAMGLRMLVMMTSDWGLGGSGALPATQEDYHAHRIGLGVPEGGSDYPFGDTFPHEALFDQLNGVSFTKGCFVGQEVVSRMQHRATTRKRIVPVVASEPLPASGTEVRAGEVGIGVLGSVAGSRGLALLRLDRIAEMQAKGVPLMAGEVCLSVELPTWATFALPRVAAS